MHPILHSQKAFDKACKAAVKDIRIVESSMTYRCHDYSTVTANDVENALRRKRKIGRRLGYGAYGRVYELAGSPNAVLKLSTSGEVDSWFYWAVTAKMLSHNPFMPRIGDIAFGIHFPRGTSANDKEVLLNKTRKNIKLIGSWENQHRAVGYAVMEKLQPIDSNANWHVIDLIESMTGGRQNVRDQKIDKLINPDFAEALVAVDRCLSFTGGGHDIHGGNIMLRGQQFVITDPIC